MIARQRIPLSTDRYWREIIRPTDMAYRLPADLTGATAQIFVRGKRIYDRKTLGTDTGEIVNNGSYFSVIAQLFPGIYCVEGEYTKNGETVPFISAELRITDLYSQLIVLPQGQTEPEPSLSTSPTVSLGYGSFIETGYAVRISRSIKIPFGYGSFIEAGNIASIGLNENLASGTFLETGYSAAFTLGGGGVSPVFTVNFTAISSLPSQISFSRASNAMVYDSTGKLTYGPNNLLTQSNTFTNVAWTSTNNTLTASQSDPDGGANATLLVQNNGQSFTSLNSAAISTVVGNNRYLVSIKAKDGGASSLNLRVTGAGDNNRRAEFNLATGAVTTTGTGLVSAAISSLGGGWYLCSVLLTADATTMAASMFSGTWGATGDGSAGTYLYASVAAAVTYETSPRAQDQVLTTGSAYYGPRFDYDPVTLTARGLLIEEQRTNIISISNPIGGDDWNLFGGVTVSLNSATGPEGLLTATVITFAASDSSQVYSADTSAGAGTYTASVFARSSTGKKFRLKIAETGGDVFSSDITTTTTLQRFTFVHTSLGGISQVAICNASTADAGAIEASDIQFEVGSFATSYIPTTTAAVTRSMDLPRLAVGGAAETAAKAATASIIAEVSDRPDVGDATRIVGSSNQATALAITAGKITLYNLTVAISGSVLTWPATHRGAVAYDPSGISLSADGSAVVTSADTHSSGMSDVFLGSDSVVNILNGHFRSLAIYNTRLSDADLQTKSVVGASF